jgi:3-hydroxyisobutyrate dehydrogenase
MLPNPEAFKNLYFGEMGLGNKLNKDCLLVDCSTVSPIDTLEFGEKLAKEYEMAFIDAPVSGGTVGAKNGTLTFMIGSETEDIFQVSFFKKFLRK